MISFHIDEFSLACRNQTIPDDAIDHSAILDGTLPDVINIRLQNFLTFDCAKAKERFDTVHSLVYLRMCCKCVGSDKGVSVYINKHNFFSILYIVQQLIDNLIHGKIKTLLWTQPRTNSWGKQE